MYLTLKLANKNQNISVPAPLSDAHTEIFQFIQKSVFDYNTCTLNSVPFTGNGNKISYLGLEQLSKEEGFSYGNFLFLSTSIQSTLLYNIFCLHDPAGLDNTRGGNLHLSI